MRKYNNKWSKNLTDLKLEETIGWKLSIVKKINRFSAEIETIDGNQGVIEYASINWTKKNFEELFVVGTLFIPKK